MELLKGYYIVDGQGGLKCKIVKTKDKETGALSQAEVPIRLRTINAARDFSLCIEGSAVLAVCGDSFYWGE